MARFPQFSLPCYHYSKFCNWYSRSVILPTTTDQSLDDIHTTQRWKYAANGEWHEYTWQYSSSRERNEPTEWIQSRNSCEDTFSNEWMNECMECHGRLRLGIEFTATGDSDSGLSAFTHPPRTGTHSNYISWCARLDSRWDAKQRCVCWAWTERYGTNEPSEQAMF